MSIYQNGTTRELSSFLKYILRMLQRPSPYLSREWRRGEARGRIQGTVGNLQIFLPSRLDQKLRLQQNSSSNKHIYGNAGWN